MITEDYVSFEVAQILKEKGFNEACEHQYYVIDEKLGTYNTTDRSRNPERYIDAPTHQMTMKWLRKKHNILLFLLPAQENGKLVYLVEVWTWNEEEGLYESTYAPMPRKEPEQAVEAALKYSLENLI